MGVDLKIYQMSGSHFFDVQLVHKPTYSQLNKQISAAGHRYLLTSSKTEV